jgi:hypothetical protein
MRKRIVITGLIITLIVSGIAIFWQKYIDSPDYNYLTAKLDIKNGDVRIINIGYRITSSKDMEIDSITSRYGFKNVYIGYDTTKQKMEGIKDYNKMSEMYLTVRNGSDWRINYQKEIDSVYNSASLNGENKKH